METHPTSFFLGDESSQMWNLNKRLEAYLSRVKALEEENELLRAEIHHLRKDSKTPSVRKYHEEIMKLRDALDDGHQKMVEAEMARDNIYQEVEYVKDLCLQEKQAQEQVKKEMSESQKLLEEEKRAQNWLKERLVQLEEEMEDILRVHEEEKAALEEEISSFSRRLDSFKVAPIAFQPVNVEDYSIKLSQIWQGAVEDYKSEVSALESGLSEAKQNLRKVLDENKQSQLELQKLDRELLSLKSRKQMLEDILGQQRLDQQEEEGRLQLETEALEKEKQDLRAQITQVLEDRQQLMHLKMSLSLEVATYRSLLEAESTRIYSPTADYKLSSPFSDSVLEKTSLRKRQAECTKTPVARDYRLISTKRQSAEKSKQLSHTPSRNLNVKSTSLSSRASPVTKEFQKVSSVLQSQSLKYTKASTEKATTTLSSTERKNEMRHETEDVVKRSKVETISHSSSQSSSKTITDHTVRSETQDQPLRNTVYSKNDAKLTKTEVENGLLPGEKEIQDAQLKTDYFESSLKTGIDHHPIYDIALEDQQGSLKVDIDVQDLQSKSSAQEEKLNVQQTEFDLPSQVFENEEADLVVEKEEAVKCQKVLFEKREDVQSLEYQNIETLIKEDVKDHTMVQVISEPFTSDVKADLLVITPTHDQESSTTLLSAEREEPKALSSDLVSENEPLTQKEKDLYDQVSFDIEHAINLSSDVKEHTKQGADEEDTLLVNQDFELTETEQDNFSLEKVETESKLQEEEVIVDQQIISTLKESNNQRFNDEEVIEDKIQEVEILVGQTDIKDDIIFDSPETFEKCLDDAMHSSEINELSKEIDLSNTEQHINEVIVSQEIHLLSSEIDMSQLMDSEEQINIENKELQEDIDLNLAQSESLLDESKDSTNIMDQEDTQLSHIKQEIHNFEEVKKSGVDESSQEHETEQYRETCAKEEFVNVLQDSNQMSEDSENSQGLTQEEQKSLELQSLQQESEIYLERKTQIICVTEQITEQFIVDDKEVIEQLDIAESGNMYVPETVKEIKKEMESLEFSDKEQTIHDILGTDEGTQIATDIVQVTKFGSEEATSDVIDVTQDTVQLFENVEDSQEVKRDEQKLYEPRDAEQDQSNLGQELEFQLSEDNQNLLNGHDTEDNVQFLNYIDDGDLSVDKRKEQLFDIKQSSSIVSGIEPVVSLPSFQEEQKDVNVADTDQQDIKWSLDQQDIVDAPTITNTVQQNQPEEHESEKIFTGTDETEKDIQFNESEQVNQEVVDSVAYALLKEGVELESPMLADRVQESETSYDQVSDAEIKISFQNFSEEISQWTERIVIQESCDIRSTSAECTFPEEHEVDVQLIHKPCDPTEEEQSTMTNLEHERQLPENETEECISEREIIESVNLIPASQESKDLAADQDSELDNESLFDTQPEIIFQKETAEEHSSKDIKEETSHDDEVLSRNVDTTKNESKECRGPEADQSEHDQQHVSDVDAKMILQQEGTEEYFIQDTEGKTSQDDLETLVENEDSKDSMNLEADQETELDQEDVSYSKIFCQLESVEEHTSEGSEGKISQVSCETVSETVEKDGSEENEEGDSKDFRKPETDQELLSIAEAKIIYQQESVFDFNKGTNEEISEESCEIVKTMVENVFSESNEEVEQLAQTEFKDADEYESAVASTEHESHTPEIKTEKCISERESMESAAHLSDVEPVSQESQDTEPDRKPELEQEPLFEIQQEISVQQEDADEYSGTSPEKQTSQENLELITKMTEQDTREEDEQDSKESQDYEVNQGQDLVEEPLFETKQQFSLEQKNEDVYFSEITEKEINRETDEAISKTVEQDIAVETQEGIKGSVNPEAEQETEFDQEEKISQVSCETETVEKDTSEENEEDSKDFKKAEDDQEPEADQEPLSGAEAMITYQQESVFDFDKGSDEEISEESCEVVSAIVENVLSEKNEVEHLAQTETAVASTEHESHTPDIQAEKCIAGSENAESAAHLNDVEPLSQESGDPESVQKPGLYQEPLSDIQQEIALQQEAADEYSSKVPEELKSQGNLEIVTEITEQDTKENAEQDNKDSWNYEVNQKQDIEELLFDTDTQFTPEQENEEVCFSEYTEEEITQESDEAISKTAEQVTTVEKQEDSNDSKDSAAEQAQELVEKALLNTESHFTFQTIKETYFTNFTEEAVSQDTYEKATPINQEKETKLPEISIEDKISGFDDAEETAQLNDYERFGKESEDPKVDQDLEYDTDSQRDEEAKVNFQLEGEYETHGQSCDVQDVTQDTHAAASVVEDYSTSEEEQGKQVLWDNSACEQDGLTLRSTEHENQSSESKLEEDVSASEDTQHNAQFNDPKATIQESFESNACSVLNTEVELDSTVNIYEQETELDADQYTETKATSEQEIEVEHLIQSGEEKEVSEKNYEESSTTDVCNESEGNEEIVSAQKEPEDDHKIPFSMTIIQNNLRFTSENDAEVQPEKQECELSIDGAPTSEDLVIDEKRSESADLQNDDIEHDSLNKEEGISEDIDYTESKQENEDTEEKDLDIVSEPSYQYSIFAQELKSQIQDNQAKYLEPETEEQREEQPTASKTESETILVEHNIQQKLYAENHAVTLDSEGPTEEQSEIEDVQTHSNLDDENSKSDESLDSQDISIYSQKSEDFEISKDYQLEQTLPDSTPLPNLDDEFEDLAEDKVIITSHEAQNVAGSLFPPELRAEVLDDNLESQSSEIATDLEAEARKQELGDFTENTFETLDESTFDNKQLEDSEVKAENENMESEESLNSQEYVSIFSQRSDNLETSTEPLPDTTPLSNIPEGSETLTEQWVILEPEPPQIDEVKEFQKVDIEQSGSYVEESESVSVSTELFCTADHPESELEGTDESLHESKDNETSRVEVQNTQTMEHTQEYVEVIAKTTETSVILESDNSISSDGVSPNVTVFGHEAEPEDDKRGTEETSPKEKESSDELAKVGLEKVEETREDEALMTTELGQEASLHKHIKYHASDEEKEITGEISDSSFDSNSGNEREAAEEQHSSSTENNIYVKTVNGLHETTIVQATLDLEDLMVNGHSTGEQSKIVISERKTIVKVEEDILSTHMQDIIEESVLKFATSEGKSEGLFQSLLEKSELKEGTRFDESSEMKNTIHTAFEYVASATDESNRTKKTLLPYLSDSDFNNQTEIEPSLVTEDLIVDKDTNQQTVLTHQEKEDSWSSDE